MRNFNYFVKKLLLFCFGIIILTSCEKNEIITNSSDEKKLNFISKTDAVKFANNLLFNDLQGNIIKKEVKEVKEILSKNNNLNSLYVLNYKNGGFVILSADNRSFPIYAVSSKFEFKLNDKNYPAGLVDWIETATDHIDKIRNANKHQDKHTQYLWDHPAAHENILLTIADYKSNSTYREPPIDPDDPYNCIGNSEIIPPLLNTIWDQWYGYNSSTPYLGCSINGHAPTGCVATAMAQIMKYHNYPTNYNWSLMPNNYGTNETSNLMSDIGDIVGMSYSCNGSSANTESSVANAFISFGYQQSANFINYEGTSNYNVIKSELQSSKPVILRGGRKRSGITWPWNYYTDGHAWVCDGYVHWSDCSVSMLALYMNWGWSGNYNGLYAFNNFNPSTYTFNYKSGAVVGIRKP